MAREKSPQVVAQKMAKLQPRGGLGARMPAEVLIKRKKKGRRSVRIWVCWEPCMDGTCMQGPNGMPPKGAPYPFTAVATQRGK